ncbi:lantibiotic dehydratase C-terminal domain-containing protein [Krasilnikovia sp. MM14-A1259]|uniref:lantibiotic dehydratase C-terminal domain-containing protein n=1 Tax=Krasilnikovia sp. MM14-A1259 TaxID=3373539 RepID=UPI00381B591F
MPDDVWRSLHVHRLGGQDAFLTDALAPALARLRAQGRVRRAFFLRYWEGGHHLRVRVRTEAADADAVAAVLVAEFARYLREHPDELAFDLDEFRREAQPTMAALEGVAAGPTYPRDTVRAATYTPEHDKYGGPAGVAVAEEFFDRSAALVLSALPRLAERPGRRLGMAFTMMLRGLCGAGLSPAQAAAFLGRYCLLWSPWVFDEFLGTWPGLLAARRDRVAAQAARVLAELQPGDDAYGAAVGAALAAVAADPVVLPAVTLAGPDADAARRRQVLLVSYLHTHNNRLGLTPEQEAFLGFLGHHVLSEYAGTPPEPALLDSVRAHRAHRLGTLTPSPEHRRTVTVTGGPTWM